MTTPTATSQEMMIMTTPTGPYRCSFATIAAEK
jgi:hypothetical protein